MFQFHCLKEEPWLLKAKDVQKDVTQLRVANWLLFYDSFRRWFSVQQTGLIRGTNCSWLCDHDRILEADLVPFFSTFPFFFCRFADFQLMWNNTTMAHIQKVKKTWISMLSWPICENPSHCRKFRRPSGKVWRPRTICTPGLVHQVQKCLLWIYW